MVDAEVLKGEMQEVREHRTWFLVMGILLVFIGTVALGSAIGVAVVGIPLFDAVYALAGASRRQISPTVLQTVVSMIFLGWILIFSGVLEIIHGIIRRQWKGFFINLLGGVLYAVAGFLILGHPRIAATKLSLLIAMVLMAAGIFRLVVAVTTAIQHRAWLVFNGVTSVMLSLSILNSWPASGLWVIGLFIGIDVIVDGWTEIMLALSARPLPT
jgi:uncharacterized membrane protein HdeD (DUF308 family)